MMTIDDIIKLVNEMPFVEYDITLCENNKCPRRQECHRWQMYQVYRVDERKGKPIYLSMYKGDSNNCKFFWQWEQTSMHE